VVGIIGTLLPLTFPIFVKLIPFALLLSFFILMLFQQQYNRTTLFVLILIYLLSFFIEVAGVQTKVIFGDYSYDFALGIQLFDTPLIIGLNWLLLSYISLSTSQLIIKNKIAQIVLASFILLVYDIILETMAPVLNMWNWQNNQVPFRNYFAWFVFALLFTSILSFSGIKTKNKIAPVILICQVLFFLILFVGFKIVSFYD
jgi:putative membrane protein